MKLFSRILIVCSSFFFINQGHAVSEELLPGDLSRLIDEYYTTTGTLGTLTTEQGIDISYRRFDNDCGNTALILVPGWSEPKKKYAELIYDLKNNAFCIYILDHRSQGSSSRLLPNSQITYVKTFNDYVEDLKKFDQQIVRSRAHKNVFVLAHSMGGLIATHYIAENPENFSGLVLSAPMFQPDTGALPESAAYGITGLLIGLGQGESFVPSHGEWQPKLFSENEQTSSEIRFARSEQLFIDDKSLIVSGVSNQWLHSAIDMSRKVDEFEKKTSIPILLFQATDDTFVKPERQDEFCAANPNCQKVIMQHAKHEILMEIDPIRSSAITRIQQFINQYKE